MTAATFPVSLEATLAEAQQLVERLSFLLACAVSGPSAALAVSVEAADDSSRVGELS